MVRSFYNQRGPRQFNHKPIYWDPEKERLEKRVELIRRQMEASGELPCAERQMTEDAVPANSSAEIDDLSGEHLRGTFVEGTRHLRRQQDRGINNADRARKSFRLILTLLLLGFVAWFFFFRNFNVSLL